MPPGGGPGSEVVLNEDGRPPRSLARFVLRPYCGRPHRLPAHVLGHFTSRVNILSVHLSVLLHAEDVVAALAEPCSDRDPSCPVGRGNRQAPTLWLPGASFDIHGYISIGWSRVLRLADSHSRTVVPSAHPRGIIGVAPDSVVSVVHMRAHDHDREDHRPSSPPGGRRARRPRVPSTASRRVLIHGAPVRLAGAARAVPVVNDHIDANI